MAQSRRWYQWPRHWRAFRDVPFRRLWRFGLAVFLLFSVIGFYNDLIRMGQIPYATTLAIAAVCGANAVLWITTFARLSWPFLIPLTALQFVLGPMLSAMAGWMSRTFSLAAPTAERGVFFASTCTLVVVMASYWLIIVFFQGESRETYRIRNELELAHGIQKTLVPPVRLRTKLFEVYGISQPSDKVGGDLVDAVELENGDVIAYLADIAGHGLSAGILMGMLKTAARTALLDAGSGSPEATLPLLLEKLNRVLPDVKEPQMYATVTAFRLNADGRAWVAMAASPPVLHWHAGGNEARRVHEEQYPVGLLPVSGFRGEPLALAIGDLVAVATDGVLEVCNPAAEEFGIERLEQAIAGNAQAPLEGVAERILASAEAFGKQEDDQTVLLVRRR
jgi:serine phosphatase RsbU (regulator of sigma subunit)